MTWRDDIADRARNGDAEGVLKIFDELDNDRERVRALNAAYLQHIADLLKKGNKTDRPVPTIDVAASNGGAAVLEACARARSASTEALKEATGRMAAP